MVILYVLGVWGGGVIYVLFPLALFLLGYKKFFFELLILVTWILILSDYIPTKNATYDSLKFAKELKNLAPLALFGFIFFHKEEFKIKTKLFLYFVPFFVFSFISLTNSVNLNIGIQKTISFILMYFSIPIYVHYLHKKDGEMFWKSLITYLVGMLMIGLVLGVVVPEIGIHSGGRFKGVLGNPNGLGIFTFLVYTLYMIIKEFKLAIFSKQENIAILMVIGISVFWCESRNTIMSIFLFYLTYRFVKINWILAILVVVSLIIFEDLVYDLIIRVVEFFGFESYFRVHTIEQGSGRKIAWAFAWGEIQKTFFIGGGFGHDENIMRANYYWLERKGHSGGVHNSYLSMMFDTGIIGVVLYFGALIFNLLKSVGSKSYIAIAFLVALFFNVSYESWLVASLNPFTILFIIILTVLMNQLTGEKEKTILNQTEVKPINE